MYDSDDIQKNTGKLFEFVLILYNYPITVSFGQNNVLIFLHLCLKFSYELWLLFYYIRLNFYYYVI